MSAMHSSQRRQTDMGWPDHGPFFYHLIPEPHLTSELSRLSDAKSIGNVDCVTFQPCPDPEQRSQDRYEIQEWQLPNGTWKFAGVFDGHAGHETVDHTAATLPTLLKSSLISALKSSEGSLSPTAVSSILVTEIASFDDSLTTDLLDLFPGGTEAISKLSDAEIRAIINDSDSGGKNLAKVLRCMRGSTCLISLIDPLQSNLWVASLGDCQAVLGSKNSSGEWRSTVLSSNHNGKDANESERIRSEHPGEEECVQRDRVLGAIAVTRALGDQVFKLPTVYTERIFMNAKPGFRFSTRVDDFLGRNLTPPYVSNQADVQKVDLGEGDAFLILCSDGLMDLYEPQTLDEMAMTWVELVGATKIGGGRQNAALRLLREGLGGEDGEKVSRVLTVELMEKWMDDTTVIVLSL